jgi:hypothetical protein
MVRSPRLDVTEGGDPGRADRYSPKRDPLRLGKAGVGVTTAVSTGPGTMLA